MFEVRDLRMVLAIVEHRTMVRAARILRVAQPALTRQLAALEAKLRGPLFERTPRGMLATDLGRTVAAEAHDIIDRLLRLDRHAVEARDDQVRDLTIVAGGFMAESIGLRAAARMLAAHPQVRIRLTTANWAEIPALLQAREASIGLFDLRGLGDDPAFEVERLNPHAAVFATRPGHPLLTHPAPDLPAIIRNPMVFIGHIPTEVQARFAAARVAARRAGGMHPAFPAVIHESPTVALRALADSDAIAGTTLAEPFLRAGTVVGLPWREPWMAVLPGIVRLRGAPLPEAEAAFIDLLHAADREQHADAAAWCAAHGVTAECG